MPSKPVSGSTSYNPLTDRMAVSLRVGQRDLLTTDDSGGTPGAHKTSHQLGGSDALSVAGLSGVLADPQVAGTIRETAGPTALVVGSVANGQYLLRSGSTVIGGTPAGVDSTDALRGQTWPPAAMKGLTAHADDEEFLVAGGQTSYTGWNWRIRSSGALPAAQPNTNISPYVAQADTVGSNNALLIQHDWGTNRRSWLQVCPPDALGNSGGDSNKWILAKAMSVAVPTNCEFICGLRVFNRPGGSNTHGRTFFSLYADSGGLPTPTTNNLRSGWIWNHTAGGPLAPTIQSGTISVSAVAGNVNASPGFSVPLMQYITVVKRGTAGYVYAGNEYGNRVLLATLAAWTWTPAWWGFEFQADDNSGGATIPRPVFEVDFVRRIDSGNGWGS